MSLAKKIISLTLLLVVATGTVNNDLEAQQNCTYSGDGYQCSQSAPSIAPYVALATAIIIGIVALAVRHKGNHHHSHCGHSS